MSAIRRPGFAGRFYPAAPEECERMLEDMARPVTVEGRPVGAVVPHAGWIYSGPTAALAIAALAQARPQTILIFGAVHVLDANHASLYAAGFWETPLGRMPVDEDLAGRLARCEHIATDLRVHENEHSIEVQLPLIQRYIGDLSIVPIMVRPGHLAAQIGRDCAAAAAETGRAVAFLASTDLTHYGPPFGFEPHGRGEDGIRWARDVNDRRLIDLVSALDAEGVLAEAAANHNACGAGAVAAGIAAARQFGAERYIELEHTTSADRELSEGGRPVTSVGYQAGVFVIPD